MLAVCSVFVVAITGKVGYERWDDFIPLLAIAWMAMVKAAVTGIDYHRKSNKKLK